MGKKAWRFWFAAMLYLLPACSNREAGGPLLWAVTPNSGPQDRETTIHIGGAFHAAIHASYDDEERSSISTRFLAQLGSHALKDTRFVSTSDLSAVVPAGLSPGLYSLTVTDPRGLSGTLKDAFRIIGVGGDLIAMDHGTDLPDSRADLDSRADIPGERDMKAGADKPSCLSNPVTLGMYGFEGTGLPAGWSVQQIKGSGTVAPTSSESFKGTQSLLFTPLSGNCVENPPGQTEFHLLLAAYVQPSGCSNVQVSLQMKNLHAEHWQGDGLWLELRLGTGAWTPLTNLLTLQTDQILPTAWLAGTRTFAASGSFQLRLRQVCQCTDDRIAIDELKVLATK